jgi:O-antigen ligase
MVAGAGAGVLLGTLQVSSPDPPASPWYLYRQSNFGVATGFFANGNHMATLLLACIPFIAAAMASLRERTDDSRKRWAIIAVGAGSIALALLGLILNGSLAGFVLAVPVLLASLALLLRNWPNRSLWAPAAISIVVIGAVALVWVHMASSRAVDAASSIESRKEIFRNSAGLAAEFAPFGSGIGTFEKIYRTTEAPAEVDRFYVNHAHNDYLELAVETGGPGVLLVLLFLAWWVSTARSKLKRVPVDRLAAAGTIASAMILLHSMVDYPLRTAAIGALFATCLAFMAASRRSDRSEGELRPARHLVVG